jgi:hypothetical protein
VLTGGDAAAAIVAQAEYANEQAGAGMFGDAAPNSALVAAASAAGAAELMWRPLAEWPLLPLADGRLLKLKHRELVMAVLPQYADSAAAAAAGGDVTAVQPQDASSWVSWAMLDMACALVWRHCTVLCVHAAAARCVMLGALHAVMLTL